MDEIEQRAIHCDAALTGVFTLLGKRWTGVIVGVLLERPARFVELARAIPGITEGMLSTRLAELRRRSWSTGRSWKAPPSRRSIG